MNDNGRSSRKSVQLSSLQLSGVLAILNQKITVLSRTQGLPVLVTPLTELISVLDARLQQVGVQVHGHVLRGSVVDLILLGEDATSRSPATLRPQRLCVILYTSPSTLHSSQLIRKAVSQTLLRFLPGQLGSRCTQFDVEYQYMYRIVRVCDGDRWSAISLSASPWPVTLKFVGSIRRMFTFSISSLHIKVDPLLVLLKNIQLGRQLDEADYPPVLAATTFKSYHEAIWHLRSAQIFCPNPERLYGGGLLKYCLLLVLGHTPCRGINVADMQGYMCSRFFIEFPNVYKQRRALDVFTIDQFTSATQHLKYSFFNVLHAVVLTSTPLGLGECRDQFCALLEQITFFMSVQQHQRCLQIRHQSAPARSLQQLQHCVYSCRWMSSTLGSTVLAPRERP